MLSAGSLGDGGCPACCVVTTQVSKGSRFLPSLAITPPSPWRLPPQPVWPAYPTGQLFYGYLPTGKFIKTTKAFPTAQLAPLQGMVTLEILPCRLISLSIIQVFAVYFKGVHAKMKSSVLPLLIKAEVNSIINTVPSPQPKDSYNTKALAAVAVIPCEMTFFAHTAAA